MSGPILLEALDVSAADDSGPRGQPFGRISHIRIGLPAGIHAFVGAPTDGTIALCQVASGARPAKTGRMRVLGRDPHRSALVRRRMGTLLDLPSLPTAPTVRRALEMAVRSRGEPLAAASALIEEFNLGALAHRSLSSVGFSERRAIELALALSTPNAAVIIVYEPFMHVASAPQQVVQRRMLEQRRRGAAVILATSSPADARLVADRIFVLSRGALVRDTRGTGEGLTGPEGGDFTVWVNRGLRRLARSLSHVSEIDALSWEAVDEPAEATSPNLDTTELDGERDGAGTLRFRVGVMTRGARALTTAALRSDVDIEAYVSSPPTLEEVNRATGRWLAARARYAQHLAAPTAAAAAPTPAAPNWPGTP